MKIVMFTDAYFPRINGVAVSVKSYASELTKIGHEVCVVCLEYPQEQQNSSFFNEKIDDEAETFKIIRIPSWRVIFSKEDRMARLETWLFIKKKVDEFAPDVVHINSEFTVGYLGSIYARHRKIPLVFTFHTMWEDYLHNYINFLPVVSTKKIGVDLVRYYLKRADVIISPTNRIAEVVERYGVHREVEILPTGIPDEKQSFSKLKYLAFQTKLFSKFPDLKGKKILIFVGRVVKEKNLYFLFDVLKNIQKKNKKTALLFIGDGPYLNELKELSENENLTKSVFFTGYIPKKELPYFYKIANVFVFPSLTETQGLVTVEAMLQGLPVVAIGELGTKDVMKGDNGGFMVENNVEEFSGKVELLLENDSLWEQKSAEALEWGKQWNISSLTPKLVECYEKAVFLFHNKK